MNKKDFIKISAILNYAGMHACDETYHDAETAYDNAVKLADMFDWDNDEEDGYIDIESRELW